MTEDQMGKELASIVKEALEQKLVPIAIKLNTLSIEIAKLGALKGLDAKIEARLARLEELGTELELHLAEFAGYEMGRRSTMTQ